MKLESIISKLQEEYKLPISIGDTVLMGKFKNKSVVVKSIEMSEKGDLLINGKSASRFRIKPKVEEHPHDLPPNDKGLDECVIAHNVIDGNVILAKNRDRAYEVKLTVVRELINDTEVVYILDEDTDWSEGMNEFGIGLVNSALFVKRDEKEKKLKKTRKQSKDGARIREALGKDNLNDKTRYILSHKLDLLSRINQ